MLTPSIVLRAFSPDTGLELSLEGTLVLEALDCAFITGSHKPGVRDSMLALVAMTDLDTLKAARRTGKVDELLEALGREKKPRELMALLPRIAEAVRIASEPAAGGEDDAGADLSFLEKKSGADAAGG